MDPIKTEIVVVGAGPGGYAAAFYAADLGKKVILIERDKRLGGVCLNRGCIPSKALLHATHQITAAKESEHRGITFTTPTVDLGKLRVWKEGILTKLGGGIAQLAKMRNVTVIQGRAYFEGSQSLRVENDQGQQFINYETAICAVGSLPALPKAWSDGSVSGLRARDGFEIDLRWAGGQLVEARVRSLLGRPCLVRSGEKTTRLDTSKSKVYTLDSNLKSL